MSYLTLCIIYMPRKVIVNKSQLFATVWIGSITKLLTNLYTHNYLIGLEPLAFENQRLDKSVNSMRSIAEISNQKK